MKELSTHRKFLHDLSNPLTILQGTIRKIQKELENSEGREIDRALCVDRLNKAMEAIKRMEELHSNYYQFIRQEAA